jgi:ribosomal-protein-alanine N-acetyltransferase
MYSTPDALRLPILETERLRLAPLTVGDTADIFPLMEHAEVMAFWDIPEVDDPDIVTAILESQVAAMAAGKACHWTIRTLADDSFVGVCDLSEIDPRRHSAEVGFMLGRDSWGQGYALEAMRAVMAYAASNNIRRLLARTQLGNRRSDALLTKLGFKEEGLLRGHVVRAGERRDCRLFGASL